jgi:hypothetical protein
MSLDFPEILVISIPSYEKFGCGVEILWRSKFTAKLTLTALYMSASRNFFTVIKFKIRSTGLNVFRGLKNSAIWPYLCFFLFYKNTNNFSCTAAKLPFLLLKHLRTLTCIFDKVSEYLD